MNVSAVGSRWTAASYGQAASAPTGRGGSNAPDTVLTVLEAARVSSRSGAAGSAPYSAPVEQRPGSSARVSVAGRSRDVPADYLPAVTYGAPLGHAQLSNAVSQFRTVQDMTSSELLSQGGRLDVFA